MAASIPALAENEDSPTPPWFVYILQNRLDQLYTGVTTNPLRRIRQHSGELKGGARSLKGKGPLTFQVILQTDDRSAALKLELAIKKLNKAQKLSVIRGDLDVIRPHVAEIVTCRFC